MSVLIDVTVNTPAAFDLIRGQVQSALQATNRVAYDVWQQAVPVDTGLLEASFKSNVSVTRDLAMLVLRAGEPGAGFGASEREMGGWDWLRREIRRRRPARMADLEEGAYYAYWVETGTRYMAPRAPLRATADALLSVLMTFLVERASAAGVRVETDFEGNFGGDWLFKAALPSHTRRGALHPRLYGQPETWEPPEIVRGRRTRSGGLPHRLVDARDVDTSKVGQWRRGDPRPGRARGKGKR